MKRTFLAKRNALLSPGGFSWGGAALCFAILVLVSRILLPNFFLHATAPFLRAGNTLAGTVHGFTSGFRNGAALVRTNESLTTENASLAAQNRALVQQVADITSLGASSGIIAGVLARPPESPYDTLVLEGGSAHGIAVGMEAFGAGGVPIGAVTAVTADFSRVTLFSAPSSNVAGWVGPSETPLVISGAGGGALTASMPRAAAIAAGDTIFVPGPGALPIGSVLRTDGDPSSPSVTLRIAPAINPFSVTWVELRPGIPALLDAVATSTP